MTMTMALTTTTARAGAGVGVRQHLYTLFRTVALHIHQIFITHQPADILELHAMLCHAMPCYHIISSYPVPDHLFLLHLPTGADCGGST